MTLDPELAVAIGTGLLILGGMFATVRLLAKRIETLSSRVHDLTNAVTPLKGLGEDVQELRTEVGRLMWKLIDYPNMQQGGE
jgi:hypothetical protein